MNRRVELATYLTLLALLTTAFTGHPMAVMGLLALPLIVRHVPSPSKEKNQSNAPSSSQPSQQRRSPSPQQRTPTTTAATHSESNAR